MCEPRLGTTQNFTLTGTTQQSNVFGAQTYAIRIATTGAAYFLIGTDPVADNTSPILGVDVTDYITVTPGQKIAVLEAVSGGRFSVTEFV